LIETDGDWFGLRYAMNNKKNNSFIVTAISYSENSFYFSKKIYLMKKKVLFVCLGNICRSPSAEAVLKGIIKNRDLVKEFEIDSAGTS
jgi:hypothetical protein